MKKAICYDSLPKKLSDREKAALAKEAGLDAVELHQYGTVAEAEKVAGIVREAGLEVASLMCMTHWGSPLSSTDEEVRLKGVAEPGAKDFGFYIYVTGQGTVWLDDAKLVPLGELKDE